MSKKKGTDLMLDIVKSYSRRSAGILFLVMVALVMGLGVMFYLNVQVPINGILELAQMDPAASETRQAAEQLALKQNELARIVIGTLAVILAGFSVLVWFFLRRALAGMVKQAGMLPTSGISPEPAAAVSGHRERKNHERRMFLHLLSVLQRDGRLLDFFAEDLSLYEDEQIGAAVRTIHEDCKTAMNKYLSLKPVLEAPEGEAVTIESDFDPNAVKLTGNVTGEPPFKGVVRHRGWKTTRTELPELSETKDPSIVSAAEVEVE
jgi:hypothetical protein